MTTWIARRDPDQVRAEVAATDPRLPLAGLTLAVKDNIDLAGWPTTAGCPAFAREAASTAPVVERLVAAGAVVAGKTNLDQFATGLVGTRSPYGPVESPAAPGRVAGGSSSGSAAAVARGEVDVALGTDTAGSGRVPAAFCGIVGLKPTAGWLPVRGVVPACPSLDCVSVFARDVATAARAVEAAGGHDPADPRSQRPPEPWPDAPVRRIGVPDPAVVARWCDPAVAAAFAAAVDGLAAQGFATVEVDLATYLEAGDLVYAGALVAERYASVGAFVAAHPGEVDPVVASIVLAAGELPAHALARDHERVLALRRIAAGLWDDVDAVLVPTAPTHPTFAEVAAAPVALNAALGRFTNGCNVLGWCAAAVPLAPRADGVPFGVTLLGPAWHDRPVWAAAARLAGMAEPVPGPPTGAVPGPGAAARQGENGGGPTDGDGPVEGIRLAVCGAHLDGQPLNHQLRSRGARLLARTTTAPAYRMVRLDTDPPKPGVVRVAEGGGPLEVEVWALPAAAFGTFVDEAPPPLAIGTVELADGTAVNGFLCEPHALAGAEDITHHGGWRAWLASRA